MTDAPTPAPRKPRDLLATHRELIRRVRIAQRGAWFALLLLALVTLAATPFDRYSHRTIVACAPVGAGSRVCTVYSPWAFFYWPIALVAAYAVIAGFYLHRSRTIGVGSRVRPYVVTGIMLALVVTALALWVAHNPTVSAGQSDVLGPLLSRLPFQQAVPTVAIGVGLLVLARIERSWALVVFAVLYLVVGLAAGNFGAVIARPSPWAFLPHVAVTAGVLLLGSLVFWLTQRAAGSAASRSTRRRAS